MADSSFSNFSGGAGETGPAGPAGPTGPAGPAGPLDILTDVDAYATQQWPGPFAVTGGIGAPGPGTGSVGAYYVDGTNPAIGVLYGPKQADNSWPLIGNQNAAWYANIGTPVDGQGWANGVYYVQFTFTPPSTITLIAVYGPYTTNGVSERSYLGYNQSTRSWQATQGEYMLTTEGGGAVSQVNPSATGNFGINPNLASHFQLTLTGNLNLNAFTPAIAPIRRRTGVSTSAHLVVTLVQGGSGAYTVTWPSAVVWPGGVAPTLATRVGDADVFHLVSNDAGTTWYGFQVLSGVSHSRVEKVAAKTGDYTFTRADAGNIVTLDSASNFTFTVPTNASVPLPVGTRITVATANAGHITLAGAVGVTVYGNTLLNTQGEIATLIKIGADTWLTNH